MRYSSIALLARALLLCLLLISTVAAAQTVYVTKTGTKYHAEGCRYLNKSKIVSTLSDAKANSYTACSICKPPTVVTGSQPHDSLTRSAASVQCSGTTKAGNRCKRMTKNSSGRCYQH